MEIVNIVLGVEKIFSQTTGPISNKLGINYPWGYGFYFFQMKDQFPLKGKIIWKEWKWWLSVLKIFSKTTGKIFTKLLSIFTNYCLSLPQKNYLSVVFHLYLMNFDFLLELLPGSWGKDLNKFRSTINQKPSLYIIQAIWFLREWF